MITNLLAWYKENGRHDLPWRRDRDAYHILVSELMLQQTQVPRVIPKYEAFLKRFPTVHALARAPRAEVLHAWQGLGYNNRAIRLHELAKRVSADGGRFPETREELLTLPGIGPYTAGALRIFAYDEPDLSVDVNVRRVIARALINPRSTPTTAGIDRLALELITRSGAPHDWHSALMDLGATVCVARVPLCATCPLQDICRTKGVRADEQRGGAPKAQKFLGSNRWWRGRILHRLLADGERTSARLPRDILGRAPTAQERAACAAALDQLVVDGIIASTRGRARVVEG